MGIIKIEWEIGKDRGDKVIIYCFWLIITYFRRLKKVWGKDNLKKPPKLLRLPLVKIVFIYSIFVLIAFAYLGFFVMPQQNEDTLQLVLLLIFASLICVLLFVSVFLVVFLIFSFFKTIRAVLKTFFALKKELKR